MRHYRLALLLAAASAAAGAEPDRTGPGSLATAELTAAYLECDRDASAGLLALGDAADCSLLYEELKHRVFGGDFERFMAWWRAQHASATPVVQPSAIATVP